MNNSIVDRENLPEIYTVLGLIIRQREDENGEDTSFLGFEIIGTFKSYEDAVIMKDLFSDMDTNFSAIFIEQSLLYNEVPDMDILYKFEYESENKVDIMSLPVTDSVAPRIDQDDDNKTLSATAYPEDVEEMKDYFQKWHKKHKKGDIEFVDMISPEAKLYISESI